MTSKPYIKIDKRFIGEDFPPLIIPEIGINHNGSLKKAFLMIDEAKKAKAEISKISIAYFR